jgi:hypothetical protein
MCENGISGWTGEFGINARVKKRRRILYTGPIASLQSWAPAGEVRDLSLLNFLGGGGRSRKKKEIY